MQFWPESSYWSAAFWAAASRSASANTRSGPLPPSSAVKGTRFRAAEVATSRPVSDEPVKLTRRRRPSATSVAPASSPIPWTTLKTPGGMPASSVRSARSEHESGAHSGGLRTTAHPAASAGRGLPGREHERRVPGRDHGHGAGGHAEDAVPGPVRAPVARLVALGEIRVGAVVPGAPRDDARAERALEHGHVEALDGRDPLDVRVDQVGQPPEDRGAAGHAERCPLREGGGGRLDREAHLAIGAARDLGEQLVVDGRAVLEALVAGHPLPADEVVGRDGDAGHGRHDANTTALGSTTVLPPSIAITAPVVNPASSEASQATAAAISSGVAGTAEWHRRGDEAVRAFAVGPAQLGELVHLLVGHRRPHPARADAVRAHAERPVVERDALRQHDQPCLGRAVGGRARRRAQPRIGGDRHDRAPGLHQLGHGRPAREERAGQVRPQHGVPALGRLLLDRPARPDARVADEEVETAEGACRGRDGLGGRLGIGRVRDDRERACLGRDLVERLPAASRDADAVAVGRETPRDRGSDPGAASGDDRRAGHGSAPAGTSSRV